MGGPCSVETRGRRRLRWRAGREARRAAAMFRGGAYKPRTSPLRVSGAGHRGHQTATLAAAGKRYGLPIVCELMSVGQAGRIRRERGPDPGRGAQHAELRPAQRALGKSKKPVLLKRGLANTIEEWLMSGGVHHGGRQRERRPLRAGHPHL